MHHVSLISCLLKQRIASIAYRFAKYAQFLGLEIRHPWMGNLTTGQVDGPTTEEASCLLHVLGVPRTAVNQHATDSRDPSPRETEAEARRMPRSTNRHLSRRRHLQRSSKVSVTC